ncbi:MAG: hypothetical protein Fur0014_01640 [Rubrivivax sp.]
MAAACAATMRVGGAARHLAPEGRLLTYRPYLAPNLEDGVPTAPSDEAFDAELRRRDPGWGLRRLADVAAEARAAGPRLIEREAMPANNLLRVWGR